MEWNSRSRPARLAISIVTLIWLGGSTNRVPAGNQVYATELGAVIAAVNRYNPVSIAEDREFIGAILVGDAGYIFTVSAGKRGQDRVSARIEVPEGFEVSAFWHTHGRAGPLRDRFSNLDSQLVLTWNKPFYLATPGGRLRVLQPDAARRAPTRSRRIGRFEKRRYAKGELVAGASGRPIRIKSRQ